MAAIPWNLIISASLPALIEQAGKLFKEADQAVKPVVLESHSAGDADAQEARLMVRVEQLEALEAQQAKLLKQTLEELQKVSVLAAGLHARANIGVVVSTIAIFAAVAAWF